MARRLHYLLPARPRMGSRESDWSGDADRQVGERERESEVDRTGVANIAAPVRVLLQDQSLWKGRR